MLDKQLDGLSILLAVGGSTAAALVGCLRSSRMAAGGMSPRRSKSWRATTGTLVAVGAVAAAMVSPLLSVFWMLLGLNLLAGRHENVPFSTFPMFSAPSERTTTLRFEDEAGELVPIAKLGIHPVLAHKRFAMDVRMACDTGTANLADARRRAAETLAAEVERQRPAHGPWASMSIRIVLIEYRFDAGTVSRTEIPLVETGPS